MHEDLKCLPRVRIYYRDDDQVVLKFLQEGKEMSVEGSPEDWYMLALEMVKRQEEIERYKERYKEDTDRLDPR